MTKSWISEVESFPWWDRPTEWAKSHVKGAWFIKPDDSEGYFLVDTDRDTYEVCPSLSYTIDDAWYEEDEEFWLTEGTPVEFHQLGKWQFLYGLRELHLPRVESDQPQDVWVFLQGGWSTMVTLSALPKKKFFRKAIREQAFLDREPGDFRQYISQKTGLTEREIWVFSCLLDSYNLGLAIVPKRGRIETFEMNELRMAIAEPDQVVANFAPSDDLSRIAVGQKSFSFNVSGTYGPDRVDDVWYQDTLGTINRQISAPLDFREAVNKTTHWDREPRWLHKKIRPMFDEIRSYLGSDLAEENFRQLEASGLALAIVPLGGRTIWRP